MAERVIGGMPGQVITHPRFKGRRRSLARGLRRGGIFASLATAMRVLLDVVAPPVDRVAPSQPVASRFEAPAVRVDPAARDPAGPALGIGRARLASPVRGVDSPERAVAGLGAAPSAVPDPAAYERARVRLGASSMRGLEGGLLTLRVTREDLRALAGLDVPSIGPRRRADLAALAYAVAQPEWRVGGPTGRTLRGPEGAAMLLGGFGRNVTHRELRLDPDRIAAMGAIAPTAVAGLMTRLAMTNEARAPRERSPEISRVASRER